MTKKQQSFPTTTTYMDEKDITLALSLYLNGLGYKTWPLHHASKNTHGPDIVAYHPELHDLWMIEAKSDKEPTKTDTDGSITRLGRFENAIGQIVKREAILWKPKAGFGNLMPIDTFHHGLAFSDEYRYLYSSIHPATWKRLALTVFYLRPNDPVPTIIAP